jgi:hypothetical protein
MSQRCHDRTVNEASAALVAQVFSSIRSGSLSSPLIGTSKVEKRRNRADHQRRAR